jgi:hypothetical protein
MKQTTHSYFVVMQDYGKRGREAIVDPEITRREVVARLVSGEYRHVNFIHHVDGGLVEDVTSELFDEAEQIAREAAA